MSRLLTSFAAGIGLPLVLSACGGDPGPAPPPAPPAADAVVVGTLEPRLILEASGLAQSLLDSGRLWVVNDGGHAPLLHAVAADGRALGTVRVAGVENRDWEDLASFRYRNEAYLLIADIGDNRGVREHVTLYAVAEPERLGPDEASVTPSWTLRYTYPDGPRDAESVAVDAAGGRILVLTKRTVPAELHELPLHPEAAGGVLTTQRVAVADTLPARDAPGAQALHGAIPYHWQPTAMDIAADGSALAVLTYADVYYYPRAAGESWAQVLSRPPRALGMPLAPVAESVAFDRRDRSVFVTTEGRHAPLLRLDYP